VEDAGEGDQAMVSMPPAQAVSPARQVRETIQDRIGRKYKETVQEKVNAGGVTKSTLGYE